MKRRRHSEVRSTRFSSRSGGVVMRPRFVLMVFVVLVGLVSSGCGWYLEGLGDKDAETCDCPTLQATVASIDWTGDAREPTRTVDDVGFAELGDFPLKVQPVYETLVRDEAEALFVHIADTMDSAGFEAVSRGRQDAKYRTGHWDLNVYWAPPSPTGDRVGELIITLHVDKPDDRAPEYLAPIVVAFGTR